MSIRIFQAVALSCALGLTACVTPTPTHVPLASATRDKIASTEVVAPIRQSEIVVFVPISNAGSTAGAGFGLVGALVGAVADASINAQRTSSAERDVKLLRDATVDYDFDGRFKGDVQTALSEVAWLKVSGVRVAKDITYDSFNAAISGSKDPAVLIAVTTYELANDGSVLTIKVTADLFPNSDDLRAVRPGKGNKKVAYAPENALYRNTLTYVAPVPNASGNQPADAAPSVAPGKAFAVTSDGRPLTPSKPGDRAANIALWSADNGAALRSALDKGSAELARQLAEDIQAVPPAVIAAKS